MAFVYCNDRWKNNKENTYPGPCQYSLDQPITTEPTPTTPSRLLKPMKRYKDERNYEEKHSQQAFKEMVNQRMTKPGEMGKMSELKCSVKKGKLYRNHSMEMKNTQQKFIEHQNDLKMIIKNAFHSQANASLRNKWGNMRIKEMLNEHKEKQMMKTSKRTEKQNKTIILQDNREKAKEELKELQALFTTQRKGCSANLQQIHHRKSPSKKHLTYNASQSILKPARLSQPSIQDLQVMPSTVYISEKYQVQELQVQPSYNTPFCSIGASKLAIQQKSIPTGLEDDTQQEDSIEYISDATPGPGAYNIRMSASKVSSKIQKFGVTMERFKRQKPVTQALHAPIIPDYKISTNAKQEDVGFGRSTKEVQEKSPLAHIGVFYQDYNSLEYKSLKTQLQRRKANICFDSSKERFPSPKERKNFVLTQSSESQTQEEEIQEIEETKPTCIFLSNVNRELYLNKNIEDVDFSGQNVHCIANKLKKQKEHLEDYDLTPPAFMANSKRFVYKEVKPQEKKEEILGIKIEQLKKKKEVKIKQAQKGFTFSKDVKQQLKAREVPSPDRYEKTVSWIKPSYNIRFN